MNNPEHFGYRIRFAFYTKMAESEIKMSRFGRVFGAFKPNKVLGSKNPCESEYLNFANKFRKKKRL